MGKCQDCRFFREYHPSELWNNGIKTPYRCCVALVKTDDEDDKAFVIGVHALEECEMFEERKTNTYSEWNSNNG